MVVMEQHPSSGTHSSARNVSNTATSVNQVNPHSLGREFVRQYYTLLNRSPENLHRFYAEDSSLVHGTPGKTDEHLEPVYGSEEIKERILALNYKDCHAKIRQVDALETLQKGVVVQVTGELSSDGQPMRRFLQTFVLAPQSPTNYYVRNDIFRYLDEVFMEEEEGSETDRVEVEAPKPTQSVSQSSLANNAVGLTSHAAPTQVLAAPSAPILESPKQINGHPESKSLNSEPESPPATTSSVTAPVVVPEPIVSKPVVPAEPPKPLSWASRVADNVPVAPVVPVVQKSVQPQELPPPSSVTGATSPAATKVSPGKEGFKGKGGQTPRGKKFDREAPVSVEGEVGGDEKKPVVTTTYGDEQQVFVGNLPQDISEEELKSFFSKYGAIADVRINRQNQKNGAGRTPNYGFVTFEDAKVVKVLLSQKPIYFNEHRFNVEEKRSQGRGPPGNFGGRGGSNTGRGFPAKAREEGRRQRGSFGDRDSRPSEGTNAGGGAGAGGGGRRHAPSSGGPGPGGPPRGGPPPIKR